MRKMKLFEKLAKKKQSITIIVFIKIAIFCCICAITSLLYISYKKDVNDDVIDVMKQQTAKLTKLIDTKLGYLIRRLDYQYDSIKVENQHIIICNKKTCIHYSVFLLKSLILEEMENFVTSKVYINDVLVFDNYFKNSTSYFNSIAIKKDAVLKIDIAISDEHAQRMESEVYTKYKRITFALFVISLLMYIMSKIHQYTVKLYYQRKYYRIIQNIKFLQKEKEWEIEYSQKADVRINLIFTEMAKDILDRKKQLYYPNIPSKGKLPYCIILFQENESNQVCLKKLSEIFQERFNANNYKVKLEILYQHEEIKFFSDAFLYQVIYSLLLYVIHLEKQNIGHKSSQILLEINALEPNRKISISTSNLIFKNKKELFKEAFIFFATHSNPFILDIRVVFSILELNNFDCEIKNNTIIISERNIVSVNTKGSNIVQFKKNIHNEI